VERLVRKAEANYRITAELDYLLLTWLATTFIIMTKLLSWILELSSTVEE